MVCHCQPLNLGGTHIFLFCFKYNSFLFIKMLVEMLTYTHTLILLHTHTHVLLHIKHIYTHACTHVLPAQIEDFTKASQLNENGKDRQANRQIERAGVCVCGCACVRHIGCMKVTHNTAMRKYMHTMDQVLSSLLNPRTNKG